MAIPFAFPSDEDTDADYQRLDQLLSDLFNVLQQILVTQRRILDSQPQQNASRIRNGTSTNCRRNENNSGASSSHPMPEPSRLFTTPSFSTPERHNLNLNWSADLQSASSSTSNVVASAEHNDLQRFGAAMTHARSPTRRRRRRRRTTSESSCCEEIKSSNTTEIASTQTTTTQDWTQVGVNLRKIADDFYASVGKDEPQQTDDGKRPCGVNANTGDASLLSMLVPPPFSGSIWTAVIFVVGWRLLARAR